ncbi:MAG: hypothetical protein AAGD07_10355 [Planctomycetota bacterium]
MSTSAEAFFQWGNRYRDMLVCPEPKNAQEEMILEVRRATLWNDLRPILETLAEDSVKAGIDSSPCYRLLGAIGTPAVSDDTLDNVWIVAKQLSAQQTRRESANLATESQGTIPADKRTKPMSKIEALRFIKWPSHAQSERQARDWLTQSIEDGEYHWERINDKKGVYHLDDFPKECWPEIKKT